MFQFAVGERRTDRAARYAFSVHVDGRHRFDAEAPRTGAEQRKIPGPASPEAEIVADQHPARPQQPYQNSVDELVGRQCCEAPIETCDIDARYAACGELLELAPQAR